MKLRGPILAGMLASLATPAFAAAVLPLNGIFGNEPGCRFFLTGLFEEDDLAVLTPDTFTSYGTGCIFEELRAERDGAFELAASCASEGEEGNFPDTVTVEDRGAGGVFVRIGESERFGPLRSCPGTDELFRDGVQV